jgi:UDP-glucose 4-epimerase
MKVLITGGAGFIGSHLAERCLSESWSVAVLDDLSTGSFDNISHLKGRLGFSYTIDSVFNQSLVYELVDCCDFVFHLAAAVGVRLIVDHPIRTIETNVHGTEVVLRAVAKKQKKIVIASTSEVYGKSTKFPFCEDDDLVTGSTKQSRWAYACTKALDEFLALAYCAEQNVPVTIVRLFNTIGPRQSGQYGMVLPTFVREALLGQPITVFGDGTQARCFGYVGDVVEALVRIVKSPNVVGEVINVGNDREITIRGLADMVKERTGSDSEIVLVPYQEAYGPGFEDMCRRVPSLAKLQRLIHYRPSTPLEIVVDHVTDHFRVRIAEAASEISTLGRAAQCA